MNSLALESTTSPAYRREGGVGKVQAHFNLQCAEEKAYNTIDFERAPEKIEVPLHLALKLAPLNVQI